MIMPTVKHRINITVNNELYKALEILSKKRDQSLSSLSLKLIQKAIELEEDFYFSMEADSRLRKKEKRISHDRAWK